MHDTSSPSGILAPGGPVTESFGRLQLQGFASLHREGVLIFADGTLHNRAELMDTLGVPHAEKRNCTDLELLWLAYRRWHHDLVRHLRGEFVIGIHAVNTGRLFLAVDPVGHRPLYYAELPSGLVFSSSLANVVAANPDPRFDAALAFSHFERAGDATKTYERSTRQLAGGHILTAGAGPLRLSRYWMPQATGRYTFSRDEAWYECLRELLAESIDARLPDQGSIGIMLSGGLDSSLVCALLAQRLMARNRPLHAISSVLPDARQSSLQDERRYIESLTARLPNVIPAYVDALAVDDLRPLERHLRHENDIPNAFWTLDQQILDRSHRLSVSSLFSGYGGDFAVSAKGYFVLHGLARQGRLLEALTLARQLAKNYDCSWQGLLYRECLAPFLRNNSSGHDRHDSLCLHHERFSGSPASRHWSSERDRLRDHFLKGHVSRQLGCMHGRHQRHGITFALPLLDQRLLEFIQDIPESFHVKGGWHRSLIRQVMPDVVPAGITWRRDKQPYMPAYIQQAGACLPMLRALAADGENAWIFEYFLDRDALARILDGLEQSGRDQGRQAILVLASVAFISSLRLLQDVHRLRP